jgi:hypothetical protein
MQIYTSYYANRLLRTGDYTLVGISIGRNRWAKVDAYITHIAPTWDMVRLVDREVYRESYVTRLDVIGVDVIRRSLEGIVSGKPIVLLCYENLQKPNLWCHRTMFADWWKEKTGEVIEELPVLPPKTKTKQLLKLM